MPNQYFVEFTYQPGLYRDLMNENDIDLHGPISVKLKGSWNTYNTEIELDNIDGVFTISLPLHAGRYEYYYLINETLRTRDICPGAPPSPSGRSTILDIAQIDTHQSTSTIISSVDEKAFPSDAFQIQFRRKLSKIGLIRIDDYEDTVMVHIAHRLTHQETFLPQEWSFVEKGFQVVVKFQKGRDYSIPLDPSSVVFDAMKFGSKSSITPTEIDSTKFNSFIQNHKVLLEKGRDGASTLVWLTTVDFITQRRSLAIVVICTDWTEAAIWESELKETKRWLDLPVFVTRDRFLQTECAWHDKIVVGTCGGGSGMTIGAILKDQETKKLFMLQCAHGYKQIGDHSYYPPPDTIGSAYDECTQNLEWLDNLSGDDAESRRSTLAERSKVLKRALDMTTKSEGKNIYTNATAVTPFSIGKVAYININIDTALIELKFSSGDGFTRSLNDPPNKLERQTRTDKEMPSSIIKLSTLSLTDLQGRFARGEDHLMKWGHGSGMTKFYITEHLKLYKKGRQAIELIPLSRSACMDEGRIVIKGDSSAPVFDREGTLHGHITATLEEANVGFMVLWGCVEEWSEELGLDLELA